MKTLKGSKKSVVDRENPRFADVKHHSQRPSAQHPGGGAQADLGTLAPLVCTPHDTRQMPTATLWRLIVRLTLMAYWLLLLAGTHWPLKLSPGSLTPYDKGMHFVGYAGLALLLAWVLSMRSPLTKMRAVMVLAMCALYGAIDETTQPLTARTADLGDWLADLGGAATGLAVFSILAMILRRNAARQC